MPLGPDFPTTLAAARTGAEWAWRELYRDLAPTLLGYLRRNGAREPEDLVSEVFLLVVRRLATFDGDEDGFRSWFFTIAHHRLIDDRRSRARRPPETSPTEEVAMHLRAEDTVEIEAVEHVTASEISQLLHVLTDEQREVVILRLAGFTITEIADIIGRTENATKALQRRGLRSLDRHLHGNDRYSRDHNRRRRG